MASKHICRSEIPLIFEVIPVMDMMNAHLEKFIVDLKRPASIRAAAARGYHSGNKWYQRTDQNRMMRVGMGKLSCSLAVDQVLTITQS